MPVTKIPSIDTDEYWLRYLYHGMYIEVPVTAHHKKIGVQGNKHWCANSVALRDLHPGIYDVTVEREGVTVLIDLKRAGKMKYILGLDLAARKIAEENDTAYYVHLKEEEIEDSLVNMMYVGSKKVREDSPEQKERRSEAQQARRLEEQNLKFAAQDEDNGKKNGNGSKKSKKVEVKAHLRMKRRADRWAA